jgi:hypothetical protein
MRFVDRNQRGEVIAIYLRQQYPGQEQVADESTDLLTVAQREAATKFRAAAQAHIQARYPEWRQWILTSHGVVAALALAQNGRLTASEQAGRDEFETALAWIRQVQAEAARLEAAAQQATAIADLVAIQANWPA